jgi:superfamily I DNA/RNA helicase
LIGFSGPIKLGQKIKKTGAPEQLCCPIFAPETLFPSIRQETIHQVKGESIDAVLFLGSTKFFNSVVNSIVSNENTEDRRLAYVAMTRAKHLLLVGLPAKHYDLHAAKWLKWGFKTV